MIFKLPSNPKAAFDVIAKISEKTGVYLFLDKNKKPIYVGKAINLKKRIKSHWQSSEERLFETAKFLKIKILDSEVAALIKESELIKKLHPKLNVVFRDDKQYFYLCFSRPEGTSWRTNKVFPKISILHRKKDFCLGPYTDGRSLKSSLSLVRKAFPFCSCKIPHLRRCLNSQIGLCFGFCCEKNHQATKKEIEKYRENIKKIKKIFSGKDKTLKKEIEKQIKQAVKTQDFENAQVLKLQLQGLEKVFSHKQYISETAANETPEKKFNPKELEKLTGVNSINRIEFYDSSQLQGSHCVGAMTVWHRVKRGSEGKSFDKTAWRLFKIKNEKAVDDLAMLKEVFERRLNHPEWQKPDLVIIDGGKNQLKTALAVFNPVKISARGGSAIGRGEKVIALMKNSKHQPEFLLIPDSQKTAKVVSLKSLSQPLKNFLEEFSAKTHGFAIRFHRKRRDKI